MNPNQPASMVDSTLVEPALQAPQMPPTLPVTLMPQNMSVQPEGKKRVNKTLIIAIIAGVVFLVVLLVVLLVMFGGKSGQFVANYKNSYRCSIEGLDEDGGYEFELNLSDDNSYRFAMAKEDYSIGTYQETGSERITDKNGAREINYHLLMRHEKDFMGDVDITERSGQENEYVVNFSENSDIVVINNVGAGTMYYCKVK